MAAAQDFVPDITLQIDAHHDVERQREDDIADHSQLRRRYLGLLPPPHERMNEQSAYEAVTCIHKEEQQRWVGVALKMREDRTTSEKHDAPRRTTWTTAS